ncbi:MAG: family 78 glycoside hydrolase catalytic domain [Nocardioides sp.]
MTAQLLAAPTALRAEHRQDALGLGNRTPRLSWRLPEATSRQLGYTLRLDAGTTVSVEGGDQVLVPWPWEPLRSGEPHIVEVRVLSDQGWSGWSDPLAVEAGLDAEDWTAEWVSPEDTSGKDTTETKPGFRPAYRLRGELTIDRPVLRARLHLSARGLVEPWLDGHRVGEDELLPGYTEYQHHLLVTTYDVTELLTRDADGSGRHILGAFLADGWYRGQVGMLRAHDQWGTQTALLAQLVVTHADGGVTVFASDDTWRWQTSHILAADLIEGQREDLRLLEPGWCTTSYDAGHWRPVATEPADTGLLRASPAPPVRPVELVRPVSITQLRPGVHVVDLGQNINGRIRLTNLGPAGTELTLTHGEALGADGDVTIEHLRPDIPLLDGPLSAGQVDTVISAGIDNHAFDPRFTTHGFRYVRIEGHPGELAPQDVAGVVVHTDLEPRGTFACSDDRLVRLHDAAVWSLRDNACDIPTDCPTRERAGWTGDWQLFIPIATFLYDVAGLSLKWLRDLAATQWEDGIVGNMAPMPPAEAQGLFRATNGSAGWGDAIVLVPCELHEEYADRELLAELWPAMQRWLDRAVTMARTGRHPERAATRPDPLPHEDYLWDTGFHWGEWLEPGAEPKDFPAFIAADKAEVATAYLAWSAWHASRIAAILGRADLGRAEDEARWQEVGDRAREAWQAEFVLDGRVTPHTQANLVRALNFGLLPSEHRQRAADDLAALVAAAGNHLTTGFLATPDLLAVLADNGHLEQAYALLLQESLPSWLGMVARGATTVWERWDGIDDAGLPHESLNHYSKGAVVSFLHRYIAGLQRVETGWRRFRVQPRPGGQITWATAEHTSPYGVHAVSWTLAGTQLSVEVTAPPGTTAEVVLPDGSRHEVGPGTARLSGTLGP